MHGKESYALFLRMASYSSRFFFIKLGQKKFTNGTLELLTFKFSTYHLPWGIELCYTEWARHFQDP